MAPTKSTRQQVEAKDRGDQEEGEELLCAASYLPLAIWQPKKGMVMEEGHPPTL